MELLTCAVCCDKKTAIKCDVCSCASCKHCCYFIDEDSFDIPELLPEHLKGGAFCPNCYNDKIGPEMDAQLMLMQKAKDVNVFDIDQSSETRLIKRVEKPLKIKACDDREETLLRLAFLAAQKGYDTLVDVDLRARKVGDNKSYRKLVWDGSAVPVKVKQRK